jgi:adenylate cyclase
MLQLQVSNQRGRQQFDHAAGPLEFGRGPQRESVARCVIQDDLYVSKDHLRAEELPGNRVRLTNLSQRNPVWLGDDTTLAPGTSREMLLPVRLTVGETAVSIEVGQPEDHIESESLATIARPIRPSRLSGSKPALIPISDSPNLETLTNWFETVITVQRAAAGSPEFYAQTAQALIDLVGMDRSVILIRRGELWEPVARAGKSTSGREFSQNILNRVLAERRTFFQSGDNMPLTTSLAGFEAVVASPIFDGKEQIVGVLYGSRSDLKAPRGISIGPLEAQIVQVLASAVSAGLARLEQEAAAKRRRVQFEQFFSPSLALELQRNPKLLEGQEREVTLLSSDIRGFSRLSERLAPHEICQVVREVMNELTEQVRLCEGVVVDYAGDGMMAMWNAPADQQEHAALACRAALAIAALVPRLSATWSPRIGSKLALGLGINTGPALVGNTGSMHKFKYGPLGMTVNLANRVESATKHLGIPILITGPTQRLLGDRFATRRLTKVRLADSPAAIDLYELHAESATPEWLRARDIYEAALAQYEAGQWAACGRSLYTLFAEQENNFDIPYLTLAARALECLKSPPKNFEPILDLSGK